MALYVHALRPRLDGKRLDRVHIISPFVVRTVDPPPFEVEGRMVLSVNRMGKRLILSLEGALFVVIHLMIAGRFQWRGRAACVNRRTTLLALDFEDGALHLTEAGTKKRASVHIVRGDQALREHDPGGIDVLSCDLATFQNHLTVKNRTLKRALTDPHAFDGIGNAYSDEILHAARLSPIAMTSRLSNEEIERLFVASQHVLREWIERLIAETGDAFPAKVTAFRPGMAVHGKFGQPCPVCRAPVARIVRADNEINYCPGCQTGGRIVKDRSLSRLLRDDWPREAP